MNALAEPVAKPVPFDQARHAADKILAHPEFRTVTEQSPFDRQVARLVEWIYELFNGLYRFGTNKPWIVPLMEWTFFGLAAAGLLVWGFRVMQRQRLAVLLESSATETVWRAESDNWAERARTEAAKGDWREAVHSLYWATIVMMEGRKFWRPNRARTPREYLNLLEPDSTRQKTLGGLTRIFERIWYGQRPAAESDYERARALFEELRHA